jgi:hypothetical protein
VMRELSSGAATVLGLVVLVAVAVWAIESCNTPRSTEVCGTDAAPLEPPTCDCAADVASLAGDVQLALDRVELLRQRLDAVAKSVPGRVRAPFVGAWPEPEGE